MHLNIIVKHENLSLFWGLLPVSWIAHELGADRSHMCDTGRREGGERIISVPLRSPTSSHLANITHVATQHLDDDEEAGLTRPLSLCIKW